MSDLFVGWSLADSKWQSDEKSGSIRGMGAVDIEIANDHQSVSTTDPVSWLAERLRLLFLLELYFPAHDGQPIARISVSWVLRENRLQFSQGVLVLARFEE
jgi:hypothetical protein